MTNTTSNASTAAATTQPSTTATAAASASAMDSKEDYAHLSATDLSAIILKNADKTSASKANSRASSDRGFCSASSDISDDYQRDSQPQSPACDNSADAKLPSAATVAAGAAIAAAAAAAISAAAAGPKNKRKKLEPTRVILESDYPLKKRNRFVLGAESGTTSPTAPADKPEPAGDSANPFRPWASAIESAAAAAANPAADLYRHPAVTTSHRIAEDVQDQPLALLKKPSVPLYTDTSSPAQQSSPAPKAPSASSSACDNRLPGPSQSDSLDLSKPPHDSSHPITSHPPKSAKSNGAKSSRTAAQLSAPSLAALMASTSAAAAVNASATASASAAAAAAAAIATTSLPAAEPADEGCDEDGANGAQSQRNYKNMTRERRIEANARERTRVHTISAAFESLRKSVPSYAQTQKLSKLSVLRVACAYIMTLSRMAGEDYSHDGSEPSVNECTDDVTRTIQTEGKVRKKKDD